MKPIKLTINAKAYDCYIYGGYVFFVLRDGRIMFCSYPKLISRLQHKYNEFSGMIKIAFLRNEYFHSDVAKTFLKVPSFKDCLIHDWSRLSSQKNLTLDFNEIEDILAPLCTLPSTPLDIKIYGMRLFVGCMNGMYEVRLCPDRYNLNPQKIERCFDGKVIHLNAKYGEVVLSLGMDGMASESIDVEGDAITKIRDNKVYEEHSNRTSWADTDIMNYRSPSEFSYFHNETMVRKRAGQKKFWEKYETKKITSFGSRQYSMDDLISKSDLKKDDILFSFNSQEKSFIQLRDGSIVSYKFKGEEENSGEEVNPHFSPKRMTVSGLDSTRVFGRALSGVTIPKGCAVEFFDKVVLFQNSTMQIIEDEQVMKVRSFMNTYRFQDILSVTKMDSIVLNALDTLNIQGDVKISRRRYSSGDQVDKYDDIDPKFLSQIATQKDGAVIDEKELPW